MERTIEPEKEKQTVLQVTKEIPEEEKENKITEPMDTIIISPLGEEDIRKINDIQNSIESIDETMKSTRQKSYKLHLTHLAIQRKNLWWFNPQRLENIMNDITTNLKNSNQKF